MGCDYTDVDAEHRFGESVTPTDIVLTKFFIYLIPVSLSLTVCLFSTALQYSIIEYIHVTFNENIQYSFGSTAI